MKFKLFVIVLLAGCLNPGMGISQVRNPEADTAKASMGCLRCYFCREGECETDEFTKYGIKGGFNFAKVAEANIHDDFVETSFNVGLFAKMKISDMLYFQPELNYSGKPARVSVRRPTGRSVSTVRLNYIELPLLGVCRLAKVVDVHFGPYIGFMVDVENLSSSVNGTTSAETERLDYYKTADFGVAGGISYDIKYLTVGARYVQGLMDVGEREDFNGKQFNIRDAKNSLAQIYFAINY